MIMHHQQLSSGKRQGTPWTGRQSITGPTYKDKQPCTLTFTPMDNFSCHQLTEPNMHVFRQLEEAGVLHTGRQPADPGIKPGPF